jgi:hypothetical protein
VFSDSCSDVGPSGPNSSPPEGYPAGAVRTALSDLADAAYFLGALSLPRAVAVRFRS